MKIATVLTNLTRKIVKYKSADRFKEAFYEPEKRLTSVPILALPANDKDFVVYSDALRNRLGCVLIKDDRVIAYASR